MKFRFILFLILCCVQLFAQEKSKNILKDQNLKNGIALQGYDPLGYFNGKVQKGKKEYQYNYQGSIYYFLHQINLNLFKANPSKYEPAYGGWCAYAMGNDGTKVEVDPETYKIINNRLYLFYNFYFSNTLKKWNEDEAPLKSKADKNWEKIISK